MYQFTFKCKKCGESTEDILMLGRDNELNLIAKWECDGCGSIVNAKTSIEDLFDIQLIKQLCDEHNQTIDVITESDAAFLTKLGIVYEEGECGTT